LWRWITASRFAVDRCMLCFAYTLFFSSRTSTKYYLNVLCGNLKKGVEWEDNKVMETSLTVLLSIGE